jgi:hypothetical protein
MMKTRRTMPFPVAMFLLVSVAVAEEPIDIGSRRELMVDQHLIDKMTGVRLVLHHPTPREIVLVHDKPWEGSASLYHSVFQDGDRYRMYYYGGQMTVTRGKLTEPHEFVTCYAESRDGVRWTKPELGLIAFEGSKQNNIVLTNGRIGAVNPDAAHIAMFKDDNPRCTADARYKAIVRSRGPKGLLPFKSPDGLRWSPMSKEPVITKGAFDSQNLAFWDSFRGEYRAYFRYFTEGEFRGRRDIFTATSKDFLHWTEPVPLVYPGAPKEHLYTNQIKPYYRAPHILIGFPTRYIDRGWSKSMESLPEVAHRRLRSSVTPRYGTAVTEGLLMTSRDGVTFHRWAEAFLRPGPERPNSWAYGNQYIAWHVVETASSIEGAPPELSLYASDSYWTGRSSRLRRYTLRLDGFVSAQAPYKGGEFVTKTVVFSGHKLQLNFASSAAGGIRIEIQNEDGQPIEGFFLKDCPAIFGDAIDRTVTWRNGADVSSLAGKSVRLRFQLKDADLYAFQFVGRQ